LAEEIKIKQSITERDDIADILGLVPQWFIGALFWVAISELVLKRLYPNDFIKLQAAIVAADVVGDMPPGVAMVAIMYNTLYLVEVQEDLAEVLLEGAGEYGSKLVKFWSGIILGAGGVVASK